MITSYRRVLEKAGMRLVHTEKGGLTVNGETFDKLFYEYDAAGTGIAHTDATDAGAAVPK